MPIRVACPGCGASYTVADELQGKKIRCKKCEEAIPVGKPKSARKADPDDEQIQPAPRKAPPAPVTRRPRDEDDEDDRRPVRRSRRDEDDEDDRRPRKKAPRYDDDEDDPDERRPRRKKAKQGTSFLWVLGLVGACVFVLGAFVFAGLMIYRAFSGGEKDSGGQIVQGPVVMGPGVAKGGAPQALGPGAIFVPRDDKNVQLDPQVLARVKESTLYIRIKEKGKPVSSGSGFLAYEPGIVLTNAHVVHMLEPGTDKPEEVEVFVHSGQRDEKVLKAEILGVDRYADLAVMRVPAEGLPPPLEVKSAQGLLETQPVHICGFPLGERLGKEVTIMTGQVSSFRRDSHGNLYRVQIKGDMLPGCSGGPVVDDKGTVIGVSVSIIVGARINFAVPGDYVDLIHRGRLTEIGLGQAFKDVDKVRVPVRMELINPTAQVERAEIEVWSGDSDEKYTPPPSADVQPPARPGDSPRQKYSLVIKQDMAQGDFVVPDLPAGKVCYWQPVITYRGGQAQRAEGGRYKPDEPVERRQTGLYFKHRPGKRNLTLTSTSKFIIRNLNGDEHTLATKAVAQLFEETGKLDAKKGAEVVFTGKDIKVETTIDGKPLDQQEGEKSEERQEWEHEMERVRICAPFIEMKLAMDQKGEVVPPGEWRLQPGAPEDARDKLRDFADQLFQSLQAVSLPLPNHQISPGETWTAQRPLLVRTLGQGAGGNLEMTCEYLGQRTRDGRKEALVDISGVLKKKGATQRLGGSVSGRALVDLDTGAIVMARARVVLDADLPTRRGSIKATGELHVELKREL